MATPQTKTSISASELGRLACEHSLSLLDVRTPAEFAAAHVPGAMLVPLDDLDPAAFLKQQGTSETIYVLCHSGARAARAIEKFRKAGFDNCVLVEGGTQAWIKAGLPVTRSAKQLLPLMQQVQITVGILCATGAALALFVTPWFALIPLVMGCGLLFAGLTGFCGLAMLLARMPWNQATPCDGTSCCSH